jgi:hypothetical protein
MSAPIRLHCYSRGASLMPTDAARAAGKSDSRINLDDIGTIRGFANGVGHS